MVYVGKNRGFHTRTQTEIHKLLCQFASEGARVVRLKGGDPFVFGRGGEEMEYLRDRGIIVHTIPGEISSKSLTEGSHSLFLTSARCSALQDHA